MSKTTKFILIAVALVVAYYLYQKSRETGELEETYGVWGIGRKKKKHISAQDKFCSACQRRNCNPVECAGYCGCPQL